MQEFRGDTPLFGTPDSKKVSGRASTQEKARLSRLCETGQLMLHESREVRPLIVLSFLNDHQVMKEGYFDDIVIEEPGLIASDRILGMLCPDVNDDHLIEPRFESSIRELNQTREILKIGFSDHYQLSSKKGVNTR
jgi:hypothetical protein